MLSIDLILQLLALGAAGGLMAGLLGVGGGMVLVLASRQGWQDLLLVDGVRMDRLGLEDLFVEVAG